jgi:hypothetical protein
MKTSIVKKNLLLASCLLLAGGLSGHADTVNVTVPNFSFENPASSSNHIAIDFNNTPTRGGYIQDWYDAPTPTDSYYGTVNYATSSILNGAINVVEAGNVTGGTGSQGAYLEAAFGGGTAYLTTGNPTNNDGTIPGSTGVVTTVLADTTYTLDVDVALAPGSATDGSVQLSLVDTTGAAFADLTIADTHLSSVFTNEELQFTSSLSPADLGEGLNIQLVETNGDFDGIPVIFDNVRLTESVVPEPSTWALMGLGVIVMGWRLRRGQLVV